jgi:hypothetical protein
MSLCSLPSPYSSPFANLQKSSATLGEEKESAKSPFTYFLYRKSAADTYKDGVAERRGGKHGISVHVSAVGLLLPGQTSPATSACSAAQTHARCLRVSCQTQHCATFARHPVATPGLS